jgi:hypothetical protein
MNPFYIDSLLIFSHFKHQAGSLEDLESTVDTFNLHTISELLGLYSFNAFSCTLPITASATKAQHTSHTPKYNPANPKYTCNFPIT